MRTGFLVTDEVKWPSHYITKKYSLILFCVYVDYTCFIMISEEC